MNAAIMNSNNDPYYGVKTLIIVFANTEVPTYLYDGSLAMGNLLNAAHSLGVDSCWIQVINDDTVYALIERKTGTSDCTVISYL